MAAGLFGGGRIVQRARLEHGGRLTSELAHSFLERVLGSRSVRRAALISVVPHFAEEASQAVRRLLNVSPRAITVQAMSFMKHTYRAPKKLGVDRLVNAYAAWRLYRGPAVVVDIGTAITWDAVDRSGRFLGGAIAPGPGIMAQALHRHTALLPEIEVKRPARAAGRDTEECIRSGIYWGTAAMVSELAARIGRQADGRPKLILTGGAAALFAAELKGFRHDPDLTLKGIGLASDQMG
jgi:type III pantothenate kinase